MTENPESRAGGTEPTAAAGIANPAMPDQTSSFDARLEDCQRAIGYEFSDRGLLQQSLTHASISQTRLASNERLEFLGDAILGAVICEALFRQFPDYAEGELTRIKSSVVSRHTCAKVSQALEFDRFVFLGKGLAGHDGIPSSILAAVFESVIAGIYLDGGWWPAREFILKSLDAEIARVARTSHGQNFKSQLQQLAQKDSGETPIYRLLDEKGPDHAKCFEIAATIGRRVFPSAWGASKKESEQNAARKALETIQAERRSV